MTYDPEGDTYTCAEGKLIRACYEKHSKSTSGLDLTMTVHECSDCDGCMMKNASEPEKARNRWKNVTKSYMFQNGSLDSGKK